MTVEQREWLKQMEGILEMLNEGAAIMDDRERILFVNNCMERLLGPPRSELIGKTVDALYSGKDYKYIQERRALVTSVGYDRFEFFVPRPDGIRVPVILSSRELEAPDGSRFHLITCTDITEQKKAEQSLRDANVQLEHRAEEIERDLALATRVQQSLAPHALQWGRLAVETYYMPVRTIGGDFGLVAPLDGTHLDLVVCDVSGHGISSALLANRVYAETITLLRNGMELAEMLRRLNRFVVERIGVAGFMFTMAAARVDQTGQQLTYAAAGHPPALLISPSGELRRLDPLSTILGALADAVPQTASREFRLLAGDRLMLYSDGLTEVWNRAGEMLDVEGLEKIARSASALPLPAMRQAIVQGVNSYSAEPLQDDVSLVLVEVS